MMPRGARGGAPGTGIVVIARTRIDRAADREGGGARRRWGYVIADEGSGYWLGRQALRAAMRHVDGRGPATTLTSASCATTKWPTPRKWCGRCMRAG